MSQDTKALLSSNSFEVFDALPPGNATSVVKRSPIAFASVLSSGLMIQSISLFTHSNSIVKFPIYFNGKYLKFEVNKPANGLKPTVI